MITESIAKSKLAQKKPVWAETYDGKRYRIVCIGVTLLRTVQGEDVEKSKVKSYHSN